MMHQGKVVSVTRWYIVASGVTDRNTDTLIELTDKRREECYGRSQEATVWEPGERATHIGRSCLDCPLMEVVAETARRGGCCSGAVDGARVLRWASLRICGIDAGSWEILDSLARKEKSPDPAFPSPARTLPFLDFQAFHMLN